MAAPTGRKPHQYNAEAYALIGQLNLPIKRNIPHQAHSKLGPKGGYISKHQERYRAGGVVSFALSRTHAGGAEDSNGLGWSTVTTSVIEHFNLMDVVTADRIVSRVHVHHPFDGYVPTVSFHGTRFENLRIAGHSVTLEMDLNFLGPKPKNDAGYLSDSGFLKRVRDQRQQIWKDDPPQKIKDEFPQNFPDPTIPAKGEVSLRCSLVKQVSGGYSGSNFGPVIYLPDFGRIYLATLRVAESDPADGKSNVPEKTRVTLKMIEFEMGSIGVGYGAAAVADPNGGPGKGGTG
jgi:hypothetical protein